MENISELFGRMVFNDHVMRERLPKEVYRSLRRTIETGQHFNLDVANVVASAMKEWALERGATHFTHWFQPMTGITAEKHDSFISPQADGRVIMEFSGKELVKGEPDASSFPSGGLRATFEARGYTAWDPTSYAFIKDGTLYIPTAFCSYGGEALDKKTPLLRSMEALDRQAKRVLALLGESPTRVVATVGAEQEYFLVDKAHFKGRTDLLFTGRTLLGARPPKGQELEDHYFGAIKPRVAAFMREVDHQLWQLGVPAKTKHNEVAPSQHELAPVFSVCNVAADQNQLTMEVLKTTAAKFDLVCLLHEKPFAGVNGSGKHNNWSLLSGEGDNLLEPGSEPAKNTRFLLFLAAVIRAVDEYAALLRVSVASAGNDHRLGGNEAPPAIVSMYLGDELTRVLDGMLAKAPACQAKRQNMEIGAAVFPHFAKDTTDRNRTSPFAFTGNKFEFRMVGSSASIASANIVLNTVVADALRGFADSLEGSNDLTRDIAELIKSTYAAHRRIVFNGNNYSELWAAEAERRGLPNLRSTADTLPAMVEPKNMEVFTRNHVYSEAEIRARYEIYQEGYCKTIHIEALTLHDMVKKEVIPTSLDFQRSVAETINAKRMAAAEAVTEPELATLMQLAKLTACVQLKLTALESALAAPALRGIDQVRFYCDEVLLHMLSIRVLVDELESLFPKGAWPFLSLGEILYGV